MKVLLIEDDRMISDIVDFNLKKTGYETSVAADGETGLEVFRTYTPDIVLLDIMLPGLDGFTVLKRIREKSMTPVILLTAREEERDKVTGLELGADDYVTKPFSMKELLARVKANLRRVPGQNELSSAVLSIGNIELDANTMTVKKNGEPVELSARGTELLRLMLASPETVFSRETLMEKVWGYDYYGDDLRAVDVAMRRLRAKIEDDPANPKYIMTKRGAGYYMSNAAPD